MPTPRRTAGRSVGPHRSVRLRLTSPDRPMAWGLGFSQRSSAPTTRWAPSPVVHWSYKYL